MNIADIAKIAGVSNAAVSRYFNNGYISEEKKEAIRKVVERTGYRPSIQAQTLRTKKTKMIGVIIPKIASSSIGRVVEGILEVLNKNGYQMMLADTVNDPQKELEYLNVFKDKQVDGVILLATIITPEHRKILKNMKVPIVIIGQKLSGFSCVYHDDYHCMYDMAKLFLNKGCKKIAYISAPHYDYQVGVLRNRAVVDCIRNAENAEINLCQVIGDFSNESGYRAMEELLQQRESYDGVICATDSIALGALQYLREHHYRIPEDFIFSGHGNAAYTQVTCPSITTIQFSYQESGSVGASMLMDQINNENKEIKEVMLGYSLLERESTGNAQ